MHQTKSSIVGLRSLHSWSAKGSIACDCVALFGSTCLGILNNYVEGVRVPELVRNASNAGARPTIALSKICKFPLANAAIIILSHDETVPRPGHTGL